MNTILAYIGAISLSAFSVLIIDAILVWISREPDDDLWVMIAVLNGILAACLMSILLISPLKVG